MTQTSPAPVATDDQLLSRLVARDAAALRSLMERHGGAVLQLGTRLTGSRALGEELVQETFLRVYQHADRYRPGGGARPWILTIARNLALKQCRRSRVEARHRPPLPPPAPNPAQRVEQRELDGRIQEALARIDEPYKSALVLCAVQGLSYEDAGRVCRCSPKTISSRLARARARFRELIGPYLEGRP